MSQTTIRPQYVNGIPEVNCEQLAGLFKKNPAGFSKIKLIDVRQPDEYYGELGHVKGAQLITLGPELMQFLNSADKSQEIIFICRSGARSGSATSESVMRGFTNTANLTGGMIEWNRLGYLIERE